MSYLDKAKNVFDIEIESLNKVQNNLDQQFDKAIDCIIQSKGRVVVTGMGKSGLIGRKIAATFASTGTPSLFMHPGEAYHGDLGMIREEDIIIAISNSGETEEILRLLSFFKDNKNKVISICSNKESTLCQFADIHLNISISKEACSLDLAPTSSTTATLVMGDALAVCLMEANKFAPEQFARFHPGGSLGRRLLYTARDIMKSDNLPLVSSSSTFSETLSQISSGRLGIAIVAENEKVLGIITDGDIRRLLEKEKENALKMQAQNFMNTKPIIINESYKLSEIEKLMIDNKITTVLVCNDQKLIGVVHRLDL